VAFGYLGVVQALVHRCGTSVLRAEDNLKETPIHYAVKMGHLDIVK
jgi:hypothetical protein